MSPEGEGGAAGGLTWCGRRQGGRVKEQEVGRGGVDVGGDEEAESTSRKHRQTRQEGLPRP